MGWRSFLLGESGGPPKLPVSPPTQIDMVRSARLGELVVDPVLLGASVSRTAAMSLPVVAASRNLIAGTVAQLDVQRSRDGAPLPPGSLLSRPDPDEPWSVTVAKTTDDLLFEGRAYWLVLATDGQATDRNPRGLPVRARHVPAREVRPDLSTDAAAYTRIIGYDIGATRVEPWQVIAFDAGHEGVLHFGSVAIANALALEAAARRLSNVELPAGVLRNTGHELSPADAALVVQQFQLARRLNGVAFLQGIEYSREAIDPADLQLVEARANSATDLARLFGMPVAMVAASPSGGGSALLYANLSTQQALMLAGPVGPILRSIEGALTDEAVTPRGQRVTFHAGQWLRTDPAAASAFVTGLLDAGLITVAEGRSFLGLPPAGTSSPDLTPGRV